MEEGFLKVDEKEIEDLKKGRGKHTLRSVLSRMMSNYDPFGLLSPVWLRAKVLVRRLQGAGRPVPTWTRRSRRAGRSSSWKSWTAAPSASPG